MAQTITNLDTRCVIVVSSARHVLLEQLELRVVEGHVAAGNDHVPDLRSNLERIAGEHDEVRDLPGVDAPDLAVNAENARRIERQRFDGVVVREPPRDGASSLKRNVARELKPAA